MVNNENEPGEGQSMLHRQPVKMVVVIEGYDHMIADKLDI